MMKHLEKIRAYLFYLFIFLLPLQTRYIYQKAVLNKELWEYGSKSIYATEIIFLGILLLYVSSGISYFVKAPKAEKFFSRIFSKIKDNPKYVLLPCLFLLWAALSAAWAKDKGIAWYRWTILLEGIIVYLLLIKDKAIRLSEVIIAFLCGVALQSVWGIVQFFIQYVPSNKWLGMAVHDPAEPGTAVVETALRRWLRAYGNFPHPNVLAAYLGFGLLLFIGWHILNAKGRTGGLTNHPSPQHDDSNPTEKEGSYSLCAEKFISPWHRLSETSFGYIAKRMASPVLLWIICTGILLTFSRNVWLALILSFPLLFYKNFSALKRILAPLNLSFLILFCALLFSLKGPLTTRIKITGRLELKSIKERVSIYAEGWQLIKKKFEIGTGMGNYTLVLHDLNPGKEVWDYQPIHNLFLMIVAEIGLIGVIIFFCFLAGMLLQIIKSPSRRHMAVALFFFLVIAALFDHYFWTLYSGVILWWLGLGVVIKIGEG